MRKIVFLFWGLSLGAWGKDFAHCTLANQQLKLLNDYLEPQIRVRASQALIQDIEDLRKHLIKNTSGLPDKLVKLCYELKRQAFQATFIKGGPTMYGNYDFLISAGKYFFYERVWATSYEAFDQAAKLRPNLFEPNYYALQAWVYTQLTAEKPVPSVAYQRKLKGYVDALMKSKDIKPSEKRIVLGFLATAEEKSSRIYTARTMLERSIALNPNSLMGRLKLGELEERAGRFEAAKKVYETALTLKLMEPVAEKQIYLRLSRLYFLFGEKTKLDVLLKQGLALYPKEPYLLQLSGQRLPASVKK